MYSFYIIYSKHFLYTLCIIIVSIIILCLLLRWIFKSLQDSNTKFKDSVHKINIFVNLASLAVPIIFILSSIISILLKGAITYASDFYTAFIALCTTFVVGFQIYNSIDLNKRIEKLNSDKSQLDEQIKKLDKLNKRSSYFNAYNVGAIYFNQSGINQLPEDARKRYCWNALRAYFNALCIAATGGQDFNKAVKALGTSKMIRCIKELDNIHKNYPHGKTDGDDENIMPSYKDRIHYISQIQDYISQTKIIINVSPVEGKSLYIIIVKEWKEFLDKYYTDFNV